MAHRESTAQKYYRVFEKSKSSVNASQKLHKIMREEKKRGNGEQPEERLDEPSSSAFESIEDNTLKTTTRSPWEKDSLEALQTLFANEIKAREISMDCVRSKSQSDRILSGEDPKRVYDRVQAEWRYSSHTDDSENAELAKLPEEEETVNHRMERMFVSDVDGKSMASTDMVSPSDTTVKSTGVFSADQVMSLVHIFRDMINSAPISKPVIISRLGEHHSFKEIDICQIVNRVKYECRQKRENECKKKDV